MFIEIGLQRQMQAPLNRETVSAAIDESLTSINELFARFADKEVGLLKNGVPKNAAINGISNYVGIVKTDIEEGLGEFFNSDGTPKTDAKNADGQDLNTYIQEKLEKLTTHAGTKEYITAIASKKLTNQGISTDNRKKFQKAITDLADNNSPANKILGQFFSYNDNGINVDSALQDVLADNTKILKAEKEVDKSALATRKSKLNEQSSGGGFLEFIMGMIDKFLPADSPLRSMLGMFLNRDNRTTTAQTQPSQNDNPSAPEVRIDQPQIDYAAVLSGQQNDFTTLDITGGTNLTNGSPVTVKANGYGKIINPDAPTPPQ